MVNEVLIIEDDQSQFTILSVLVHSHFLRANLEMPEIIWYDNAKEALKYASQREYKLILCDVNLRDSNGIDDFIAPYCNGNGHIPLICISGNQHYKQEALSAGAKDFWLKGRLLDLDDLLTKYISRMQS